MTWNGNGVDLNVTEEKHEELQRSTYIAHPTIDWGKLPIITKSDTFSTFEPIDCVKYQFRINPFDNDTYTMDQSKIINVIKHIMGFESSHKEVTVALCSKC